MKGRISVQIQRPSTSTSTSTSTNSSTLESGGGGSGQRKRDCECEFDCKCDRSGSGGGGKKLPPPQLSSRSPTTQFEYDNIIMKTNMNAANQTRGFNSLQRGRSNKKISSHAVVYEDMIISISKKKKKKKSPPLPKGKDEDADDDTFTLNDNEDKAEDVVVCADKSDNFGFAELVNDIANLTAEDFGMSDFVESILSPVADATESMCSPHESAFTDMLQDDAVATVSGALSKELHDLIFEYFPEEEATAAEDVGVGEVVREVIIRGEDVDVGEYNRPEQHVGKDVDENIAPCFRIPSTIDVKDKDGVTPPDQDPKRGNDNDCCCWWWRRS